MPPQPSPECGPMGTRARVGFRPNSPQQAAGMRIEPPPSLECAAGRIPAATAADAPPDEPPDGRSRFHGFRDAPNKVDSVVAVSPNSGDAVGPHGTRPARRERATSPLSASDTNLANDRAP